MKQIRKSIIAIMVCITMIGTPILTTVPTSVYAHSGRTDSSGGHHDYKNKSGLGSYHYHHGQPAHLHPNGVCPYGGGSNNSSQFTQSTPSPSISVSNISTSTNVGDVIDFDAKIENSSNTSINVTSSDPNVITVNFNNTLTAIGAGTATITIGNSSVSKKFTITVKEVYATDLEMLSESNELQVGETLQINTEIKPSNTTNKRITFETSDKSIATVSNDGVIKGISSGKVTITVSTSNGISKNLDINVFEVVPDSIECEDDFNLIVGDNKELKVNILPANSNNKEFTVSSNDENILKYSEGKMIAIKEGETSLNIETWNGIQKTIPIKVDFIPVETVEVIDSTKYIFSNIIDKSDKITLQTKILPANATYQDVAWNSSNENVIKITDNEFIVNGTGNVTLTCITHDNINKNVEIVVIDKYIVFGVGACVIAIIFCTIFIIKRNRNKKI